jgi:hypothetical protein
MHKRPADFVRGSPISHLHTLNAHQAPEQNLLITRHEAWDLNLKIHVTWDENVCHESETTLCEVDHINLDPAVLSADTLREAQRVRVVCRDPNPPRE